MLFNSYLFIFVFLPIALIGYFTGNHFKKYELAKGFLIVMSLWFYAYFRVSYLWVICISILCNYCIHLFLTRENMPKPKDSGKKLVLWIGVLLNILTLFFFKYFSFVAETMLHLLHTNISLPEILLPLGISFFTFQQVAFLVETYRGTVNRQSIIDYALFVTFFPQLIAGPIVNHQEILPQFQDNTKKSFSFESFYFGIRLFVFGLFKKVVLADTFGQAVYFSYRDYQSLSALSAFLTILFFSVQLYLDFSGYCDMARGIGKMFRIELPVNFLSPYKATNIIDFWKRWHITLTRFFTTYVYIPLGGNRKGTIRTYFNILIVFTLSGIWHGAGYTFLVWGLLHGIMDVLCRIWRKIWGKRNNSLKRLLQNIRKGIAVLLNFLFVSFAFAIFRADNLSQAWFIMKKAVSFQGTGIDKLVLTAFEVPEFFYVLKVVGLINRPYSQYLCMGIFSIIAFVVIWCCRNLSESENTHKLNVWYSLFLVLIFVWSVLSMSGVSTFLYFNF